MKTPPLVLAGAAVLALGACINGNRAGVTMDDTYIEIRAGTKINAEDQAKLAMILRKYDNKLYWVDNINKTASSDTGDLSCVYVDKTFLNGVLKSEKAGTSYSAIQIGQRPSDQGKCDFIHRTPNIHNTPNIHHTPNPHKPPQAYSKCRSLVKEVTPILEKYTHK